MRKKMIFLTLLALIIPAIAGATSKLEQPDQRIWVLKQSEAFDLANVDDYRALNGLMNTFRSEAKLDHCDAYIIPRSEGPTLLILSNDPQPISMPLVEKLFELINRELERRLEVRGGIKPRTEPTKQTK